MDYLVLIRNKFDNFHGYVRSLDNTTNVIPKISSSGSGWEGTRAAQEQQVSEVQLLLVT